jgi:hypothetical protein
MVESYTSMVKADAGCQFGLSIQVLTRIAQPDDIANEVTSLASNDTDSGGVIHMAFIHDDFHATALTP